MTVAWRPAAPVAGGSGLGSRAVRAHPQRAGLRVTPGDRAAAARGSAHIHVREPVGVLVDDRLVGHDGLPVDDQSDVEGCAAHVRGDHVAVAVHGSQRGGAGQARGGTGVEDAQRDLRGGGGRDHATAGLHHEQRCPQAVSGQATSHRGEVASTRRAYVPVEHGRDRSFVLAEARRDPGGQGDKDVRGHGAGDLFHGLLVLRIGKRPQEHHGHAVEPVLLNKFRDGLRGSRFVQGHHDVPGGIHPFVQLQDRAGDDERSGQRRAADHEHVLHAAPRYPPVSAHDGQRVAMPGGRDHPDAGPGALQDGVRADRRAMAEPLRPGEQVGPGQAYAAGQIGQPGQHAVRRIALGR